MASVICHSCGSTFDAPRKDRRWCTLDCKVRLKSQYDRARYPSVQKDTVKRACAWQRSNRKRKSQYDSDRRSRLGESLLQKKRIQSKIAYWSDVERSRMRSRTAYSRRRSRVENVGVFTVRPRDLNRLLGRQIGQCAYCSVDLGENFEFDHVVPVSRGGSHSIGNLVAACRKCNRSKTYKFITEWRSGIVVQKPI